ncbi:type II toxin-antitoxin system HicA family toxin [Nitrolancea hollandica]|uniref:type II toxin-antitoxin system HicA family toxin n=1 Tax=Nitrolancea hollandica TaxID=1206749 RepID=UPI0002F7CD41|nr:type II toxin-antitoxin system HicA family toxin [Nitrolancea hollandica]
MSKREKLIDRIRARPPEADFNDVRCLLEYFGWSFDRIRRSHTMFVKEDEDPIVVPKRGGRKVERFYLNMIYERLGLDD